MLRFRYGDTPWQFGERWWKSPVWGTWTLWM